MHNLVGSRFRPTCPTGWRSGRGVDAALLSVEDVNRDGIVQFGEFSRLGADLIMLAMPEIRRFAEW